jgi:hypothetical protein
MRSLLLVSIILCSQVVSAQRAVDSLRAYYIQEYPNHFFVWPVLKHRTLTFDISDREDENKSISFKPNNTASMGFGMYIFEVGVEVAFAIPINEEQKQIFGESHSRDLQVNVLTKSWGVDLYFQKYSGFYKDDQRVKSAIDGPNRADISTRNFGVAGFYVFNHREFSLRSSYNYSERQLKRRGSFILYGTINAFKADADSAMLSPAIRAGLGNGSDFEDITCTTLSVAPGYSYNYVWRKFFINGTLTVGPAHHWVFYREEDGTEHYDISFNATTYLRLGVGYNSDRFFGGLGFVIQSRAVTFEDIRFESASSTFRIMLGYRFKEKGFLQKRAWDFIPFLNNN